MANTVKEFVIGSLRGFYERLPLKKIAVNGVEQTPDASGVVNITAGGSSVWDSSTNGAVWVNTGGDCSATGEYSLAEGNNTTASEYASHAEGERTTASGKDSHAEGFYTTASGNFSHAEGGVTTASGDISPAEVESTTASGDYSHAEGASTTASGECSHAEGDTTTAIGYASHAEGKGGVITASGDISPAEVESSASSIMVSGNANATVYDSSGEHGLAYGNVVRYHNSNDIDVYAKVTYVNSDTQFTLDKTLDASNALSNKLISWLRGVAYEDYSHAEGLETTASGEGSHAEGGFTTASGECSHAEGDRTTASGNFSHAEGGVTTASGDISPAEVESTTASGDYSHAEGASTTASGECSHAEGDRTTASGNFSHAEGGVTTTIVDISPAEDQSNASIIMVSGNANATVYNSSRAHGLACGNVVRYRNSNDIDVYAKVTSVNSTTQFTLDKTLDASNALSNELIRWLRGVAYEDYSHAEGVDTTASGTASHAEGDNTMASGIVSHAEGYGTTASGEVSHAEGGYTTASGTASHAEGDDTTASGECSHAEGDRTTASEYASHAEGENTTASGIASHAEGVGTTASESPSHAEGDCTTASEFASHAEGSRTIASGECSHAEGYTTAASGKFSHAEGGYTTASGECSHAEGKGGTISTIYATGNANATVYNSLRAHGLACGNVVRYRNSNKIDVYATVTSVDSSTQFTLDKTLDANAALSKNNAVFVISIAYGKYTHTEGIDTTASGECSHAEGYKTLARNKSEHAQGQFNKSNKGDSSFGNAGNTIHSIGIGTNENTRENAVEVMQNGDMYIKGVAGYDGTNPLGTNSIQSKFSSIDSSIASISGIPDVSTADNGKILMVVDGQWTLVNPVVLYSGSGEPSDANGNNDDLYMQTS